MGSNAEESELDRYEDRAYRQLKEKIYKTYYGGGTFRCPFCTEMSEHSKQVYLYDDLVEHAKTRGKGLRNMNLKQQGQHVALASYLTKYHGPRLPRSPSNKGDSHGQCGRGDATSSRVLHSSVKEMHVAFDNSSEIQKSVGEQDNVEQNKSKTSSRVSHSSEMEMHVASDNSSKTLKSVGEQDAYLEQNKGKKFVYPWKGILVNVPVEIKDGRFAGESGNKLKEQLVEQGFNPEKVTPLWNYKGFSGCCMVDFIGNWIGYIHAMRFEKAFDVDHHGKTDWYKAKSRGDKLYGWVATEEDYQSNSLLRKYLKKCNLKSIEDIEAEEKTKTSKLILHLTSTIQDKDLKSKMMKNKLQATSVTINLLMDETEAMIEAHNRELSDMHRIEQKRMERMVVEHERDMRKRELRRKHLKLQEKELDRREVQNENEKRELLSQQRMNVKMEHFDISNPPEKVNWRLISSLGEDNWSPFVEESRIPDHVKKLWQETFFLGMTSRKKEIPQLTMKFQSVPEVLCGASGSSSTDSTSERPQVGHYYENFPGIEFDWGIEGFLPRVRDQNDSCYCLLCAAAVAFEGLYFIENKKYTDLSEQSIIDRYKFSPCGVLPTEFINTYRDGICKTADYPLNIKDRFYERQEDINIQGKDIFFMEREWNLFHYPFPDENSLMEQVRLQPVIASVASSDGFSAHKGNGIYSTHCGGILNHSVIITGYGEENGNKYWIGMASWGVGWGEKGYFRISRGLGLCGLGSIFFAPCRN